MPDDNNSFFDPALGEINTLNNGLGKTADLLLQEPLEPFARKVRFMGHKMVDTLYRVEMASHARLTFLNVLRDRRAQLEAAAKRVNKRPCGGDQKRRIKESLGLAICHIQTGSLDKKQVVAALKSTLYEIDQLPAPQPPAA